MNYHSGVPRLFTTSQLVAQEIYTVKCCQIRSRLTGSCRAMVSREIYTKKCSLRSRKRSSGNSQANEEGLRPKSVSDSLLNSGPQVSENTSRPSLVPRTSSAPLLSYSYSTIPRTIGEEVGALYCNRGSICSILEDPFFRNYNTPQTISLARDLNTANKAGFLEHERFLRESSRTSALYNSTKSLMKETPEGKVCYINIAVIGATSVGKSSFIQRAFGLRALPSSHTSNIQLSDDGFVSDVRLIELNIGILKIGSDRKVMWPKLIDDHPFPRVHGALLLYDVMNEKSIVDLPSTLNSLVESLLPTVLVSCKCDAAESLRKVDVKDMERICFSCIRAVKAAADDSESARNCLLSMLETIVRPRRNYSCPSTPSLSSTELEGPLGDHLQETRSQSQKFPKCTTTNLSKSLDITASATISHAYSSSLLWADNEQQKIILHERKESYPNSTQRSSRSDSSSIIATQDFVAEQPQSPSSNSANRFSDNSKLEVDSLAGDFSFCCTDDTVISQQNNKSNSDKTTTAAGITLDELVDRLTGQIILRADKNFIDVFLCVYRNFAAPGELFSSIISRLELATNENDINYLTRTDIQFRILNIISKWISVYPGDFAAPSTIQKVDKFINNLVSNPIFFSAVREIRLRLRTRVFQNDDTRWARSDIELEPETPNLQEVEHVSSTKSGNKIQKEPELFSAERTRVENKSSKLSVTESRGQQSSLEISDHSLEYNEREAAMMVPRSILPLSKARFQIFMQIPDQAFSHELTRIDWLLFSSMRVRDLLRHVSLSVEEKERCKDLINVNRMINHFNHIARWVASFILIRDKAKHRALILEKMVNIALRLRELNNYNGLAAVLAGLNGCAIYRLSQTWSLIPTDVQNTYMSLSSLMGTNNSHSAYRSAWESSCLPRIPFIPLHCRDLVTAEKGSQTFVGTTKDRINWKKFEALSQVIVPIIKSQAVPYSSLETTKCARELILDCKVFLDDEDVYERSLSIENHASTTADLGKKKFSWFLK